LAPSTIRLTAFSLFAAGFMVLGIYMRTHDLLAPTPKQMLDSLHAAQFSDKDALDLIRLTRFGLLPAGATAAASDNPVVRREGVTLYSAPANVCTQMTRVHGSDATARLAVLSEVQKEMAQRIQSAPPDNQPALLDTAEFFVCGTR
jgi:hypothetical protein